MAGFDNVTPITLGVASATVIRENRFVVIGANGLAEESNDGNDAIAVCPLGSANGNDNAIAVVPLNGAIVTVEAGAAIDASTAKDIASDNDGRAIIAAAGDVVLGKALDSATAAGDPIRILALPGGRTV